MQVQVNTDANMKGHVELIRLVEAEVRHILNRFADQIMRVEVHFTDENGAKRGNADKRCMIEARCSGRPPVAVSDESATVEGAFHSATRKLQRLLESSLGKAGSHKGDESLRRENLVESEEISPDRL